MKYYIYLHRRPDTGAVFYVGRGMMYARTAYPRRAYAVKRRNHLWRGIVARNGEQFTVEVACWASSRDEILAKEREFIAKYGKIIDRTGTLCNLTDGGDGSLGLKHTHETKLKMRQRHAEKPARRLILRAPHFLEARKRRLKELPGPMLGKKHTKEARRLMSKERSGGGNVNAKRVKDAATGIIYNCVEDAAKAAKIGKWSLYKALSGERPNRTTMRYI